MAILKMPPFRNVVAGGTAVLPQLDLGGTFKKLIFKLGGTTFTKALMEQIRLSFQGVEFYTVAGAHQDLINKSRRLVDNADFLTIHFANPVARTVVGEMIGAIDTSNATKFGISIDIGAGAVAPTLECWADIVAPKSPNDTHFNTITSLLRASHAPASAAKHNMPAPMGSNGGALLRAVHYLHTNITKLDVRKGSNYLLQEGELALVQYIQDEKNRAAQAGLLSFDPVYDDNQSNAIPTLREQGRLANFNFDVTTSDADNIIAYTELYTTVDRI